MALRRDHEQRTGSVAQAPAWALRARVSFQLAAPPPRGRLRPALGCRDLLDDETPIEREALPPAYCVPGPEVLAERWRIETPLVVHVEREPEGERIEIEDRLCVTERALSGAIATERETVGAVLERAREATEVSDADPVVKRPIVALLGGLRSVTRGAASLPDKLRASARNAAHMLRTSDGRARLRRGLQDPQSLHASEKAIALFVGTMAILAGLIVLHLVVTLAIPSIAATWRTGVLLFLYGYVSSLGIPLPWEPAMLAASLSLGIIATLVVALLAKLVAGYMVFFLGDEVNERIEKRAARSPRFARFVQLSEAFASRFGVLAMAVFIATPGLPDAIALYVFGSLGMRLRNFLLGILLGAFVLDIIVLLGVRSILHL